MIPKLILTALLGVSAVLFSSEAQPGESTNQTLQINDKSHHANEIDGISEASRHIDGLTGASIQIDSVSGATTLSRVEWRIAKGQQLIDLVNDKKTICLISTTNPDNTPQITKVTPIFESEEILKFASGLSQTRKNIDRSGTAIITVLSGSSNPKKRRAARIFLEHLDKVDSASQRTKGLRLLRMKILRVLPLQ
ncbi:MAG: hypothetical protein COA36_09825 [Desulfotalea sp.]|nr:MAG: hypothetical protein COA36_09825 [Desulfotalea sp.]